MEGGRGGGGGVLKMLKFFGKGGEWGGQRKGFGAQAAIEQRASSNQTAMGELTSCCRLSVIGYC